MAPFLRRARCTPRRGRDAMSATPGAMAAAPPGSEMRRRARRPAGASLTFEPNLPRSVIMSSKHLGIGRPVSLFLGTGCPDAGGLTCPSLGSADWPGTAPPPVLGRVRPGVRPPADADLQGGFQRTFPVLKEGSRRDNCFEGHAMGGRRGGCCSRWPRARLLTSFLAPIGPADRPGLGRVHL